jgi:hypothetical protein
MNGRDNVRQTTVVSMKMPLPVAAITNPEEYERARREVARLASAQAGSIDAAVRIALLRAIAVWERRLRRATNLKGAEARADEKGPAGRR